jgi:hypothetical protein
MWIIMQNVLEWPQNKHLTLARKLVEWFKATPFKFTRKKCSLNCYYTLREQRISRAVSGKAIYSRPSSNIITHSQTRVYEHIFDVFSLPFCHQLSFKSQLCFYANFFFHCTLEFWPADCLRRVWVTTKELFMNFHMRFFQVEKERIFSIFL